MVFQEVDYDLIIVARPKTDMTLMREHGELISSILTAKGLVIHEKHAFPAGMTGTVGPEYPRIICAFGGDGTFATAAREFARDTIDVIIGFQEGSLNFLNAFTVHEGIANRRIVDPTNKASIRTLGRCVLPDLFLADADHDFTNDVVLKPAQEFGMGIYTVRDGRGRYISSFRGDGVIVATATGSTAYNLSAGGPILHPTMDAFIVTPLNATHIGSRPIVLPMSLGLEITSNSDTAVLVDGIFNQVIPGGEEPIRFGGGKQIAVMLPDDYSFFEQARDKLGWFK